MSDNRVTALAASFVCNVASTRWPVSEACTAICAVSRSRISPIMMMSGSWRRIERSARAKSSSIFGLTCVCPTPSSAYSIGSSTVIMLSAPRGNRDSAAYSVVVLPDPVGPVTSTMPCGSRISRSTASRTLVPIPSASRSSCAASLSRSRSTTRSPGPVGSVEIRTSTCLSPSFSAIRPSCGSRFSAMSRLAMIFKRDTSAACSARGGSMTSCNTPSTRKRTTERPS